MKSILKKIFLISLLSAVTVTASGASIVYVPLGASNEIAVVDVESGAVTARIPEVTSPHGLAITPDQSHLIAGAYTELMPGQGNSPPKPSGVSEAEHQQHHKTASTENKKTVGASFVSVIDIASKQVVHRIEVQGAVHHIDVMPDGRFAIATHPTAGGISVIDLQSREVVKVISTGPQPNYAAVSKDSKRLYVSNTGNNTVTEIDTQDWSVTKNLDTGAAPEHVMLSPDQTQLYVNNTGDGTVSIIVLEDGKSRQIYPVGSSPHGVDVSDDGGTLFVASTGENKLTAINLADGEQRIVPLEPAPYHVTSIKGTGTLYVSSRAKEKIWQLDQQSLQVTREIFPGGIAHQMAVSTQ